MTGNLLQVDNLTVAYGQVIAVRDFSFGVKEGSITALVGSNGAGKTTTLRALAGLNETRHGRVDFDGNLITNTPSNHRVEAGLVMVPEGRMIFPDFTVEQNLKIGAITKRVRDSVGEGLQRAYDLFPRLRERRHQAGGTLSGGEQQMLALARGLMARPRLLMLDEPSLGLAPKMADVLFEMIERLPALGVTVLLVEQDVNRTLQIADTAYVLENGSGVMHGPAGELLDDLKVKESFLGI